MPYRKAASNCRHIIIHQSTQQLLFLNSWLAMCRSIKKKLHCEDPFQQLYVLVVCLTRLFEFLVSCHPMLRVFPRGGACRCLSRGARGGGARAAAPPCPRRCPPAPPPPRCRRAACLAPEGRTSLLIHGRTTYKNGPS